MKYIKTTQGKYIAVDDEDYENLSRCNWYTTQGKYTFYAHGRLERVGKSPLVLMHRLLMGEPEDMQVDHRDGNGLNNQRHNLRICTNSQNAMNQRKTRGSSQYKGVSWYKAGSKWSAQIKWGGKLRHLGYRDSEVECAKLYDKAAIEHFGEYANTNFTN